VISNQNNFLSNLVVYHTWLLKLSGLKSIIDIALTFCEVVMMRNLFCGDCPGQVVSPDSLPLSWNQNVSLNPMSQLSGFSWETSAPSFVYSRPPPPVHYNNSWDFELSRQRASELLLLNSQQLQGRYGGFIPDQNQPPANPRFKTEICRNYKEKGACVYGGLCQFAHGNHELRQDVRDRKYKTKPCQKYWIAGYCAYGPRCNFIHDENEKTKKDEDGQEFNPATRPPPPVIRRAGTGFTRPQQSQNSTLVRNVSDVLRIAKIRAGSQGDSGGDSGSEELVCPVGVTECNYDAGRLKKFDLLSMDYVNKSLVGRPIGSERPGRNLLSKWPGVQLS